LPERRPERFLPDANLFVAAIKGGNRTTDSWRLLTRLAAEERFELVGDSYLLEEFDRYAEVFQSITATGLFQAVLRKMVVVRPQERFTAACLPYMATPDVPDLLHAAACLETGAVLISNDRHFDRIARAGLIRRLTLSEAIRALL
jgi:predicted nucleic acid-binding protein